jgi:hypothetical protein
VHDLPPVDWDLFTSIVDPISRGRSCMASASRCWSRNLPLMVKYLKDRGVYVPFNTNGMVLSEHNDRALIDAGLDELRVSLDASNRERYKAIPWQGLFRPHHP